MEKKYLMTHKHRFGTDTFLIQTIRELPVNCILTGDELNEFLDICNKVTEIEIDRDETIEFNLVDDFIDVD